MAVRQFLVFLLSLMGSLSGKIVNYEQHQSKDERIIFFRAVFRYVKSIATPNPSQPQSPKAQKEKRKKTEIIKNDNTIKKCPHYCKKCSHYYKKCLHYYKKCSHYYKNCSHYYKHALVKCIERASNATPNPSQSQSPKFKKRKSNNFIL